MNNYQHIPDTSDLNSYLQRLRFCAQQGIFKHAVASQSGGYGDQFIDLVNAHLDLGLQTQDTGLILSINAHIWGLLFPLLNYANCEQQHDLLPTVLSGELIGGHAITEPQAGSDIQAINTQAVANNEGFILNGHKRFISNAPIANVLLVYARLDKQLSAFIVKRADMGVKFTNSPRVQGCSTAAMGDVILDNCFIPANRLLGKSGAGSMMIQSALELERAFIFAGIIGIMQWQLKQVIQYSKQRQINQQHLGAHQAISHKIADMKCRLETCLLWVNECARLKDTGKRISLSSAQTKLYASEAFLQSSLDAVHIHGAAGMQADNKFVNLVQDGMASRLFSGSSEIQKNIIAALLGTGEGYKNR